jgi:phosphoglycolate phosphatase-like HAD superfamily hydrolase
VTRLILFDIDGTLVLTANAGRRALSRAFEELFAVANALDGVAIAGRTDYWIVAEAAATHGLPCDTDTVERVRAAYLRYLPVEIEEPSPQKTVMPGVRSLLDALAKRDDAYLALLTGNFEEGARVKLEYFDLWRYFRCGAFGDNVPDRNGLLSRALARVRACGGPAVDPGVVVIVGDTPLDVAVAVAGGTRSVAVATGGYDMKTLRASGADVVLNDLSDGAAVLDAMGFEST